MALSDNYPLGAVLAVLEVVLLALPAAAARMREYVPGGLSLVCRSTTQVRGALSVPSVTILNIRIAGLKIRVTQDGGVRAELYSHVSVTAKEITFHGRGYGMDFDYLIDRESGYARTTMLVPASPAPLAIYDSWDCSSAGR